MKGYFGHMHSMKIQIYSIIFRKYLLSFVEFLIASFAFAVLLLAPAPDPSTNTETTNQKNKFCISFCLFVIVFFVRNSLIIELMKIQNL